jgi:VanZ family protein
MSVTPTIRIDLRAPVMVLILAATAVPVGIRPPIGLGSAFQLADFIENIVGYVPIGLVLARSGAIRALLLSAALSVFAEASQSVMELRDPSILDISANLLGAISGLVVGKAWGFQPLMAWRRWMPVSAAVMAVAIILLDARRALPDSNPKGSTEAGVLEAHWTFDEPDGSRVVDSSSHRLDGRVVGPGQRIRGMRGRAIELDGASYVDMGRADEFRMTGSLTVSAWIRISANPDDDAAVVSDLYGQNNYSAGFQLDTTIDRGPRAIGFKIEDACGRYAARYGRTGLQPGTWYFIAAVYDAQRRKMDVYLDGHLDNGQLIGTVPAARRFSFEPLSIGRRSSSPRYNFSGSIDEVRLYSRALARDEIIADMSAGGSPAATEMEEPAARPPVEGQGPASPDPVCTWFDGPRKARLVEARLPATVALAGMLICAACLAIRRGVGATVGMILAAAAGWLLFRFAGPTLPLFNAWTFPLLAAMSAATVAGSIRRAR